MPPRWPPVDVDPTAWARAPERAKQALEELWQSFLALNRHYLDHAEALNRFDRDGWAGAFGFEDVESLARALFGFRRDKTRGLLKIHRVFHPPTRPGSEHAGVHPVVEARAPGGCGQ